MPARPQSPRDISTDIARFVGDLASLAMRKGVVTSNALSKAEAFAFRQRLYRWRKSALKSINPHEIGEALAPQNVSWFQNIFGPRFSKDWLDLTAFNVVEILSRGESAWMVTGEVKLPAYGPDIIFNEAYSPAALGGGPAHQSGSGPLSGPGGVPPIPYGGQ